MEFLQMKRGHCDEENEEEVIRDAGNFPISHSSRSYGSSNHQRMCLGPSLDDAREEDAAATRSYHGAAAATKIQEVKLIDLTPTITDDESSYKHDGAGAGLWSMEKEHMFDKVVTPSDVGKLNRLVIPKQHAEKYFPLDSSSANEKVVLLNFEDRYGKPWRFRYCYWNSSQSYVITKGWSRFVKEKKLDAGDIVSFERVRVGELTHKDHRMFIDWRHRSPDHTARDHPTLVSPPLQYFPISGSPRWGRLYHPLLPPPPMSMPMLRPYQNQNQRDHSCGTSIHDYHIATNFGQGLHYDFRSSSSSSAPHDQIGAVPQTGDIPMIVNSAPVVVHMSNAAAAAAPKRLRLFGVNMDCSVPQESKGIVLPSVPYVTTAASVLYPHPPPFSSLRRPPPSRLHDGASMPTLQPEFPGIGHSSRSLSLDI